MTDDPRMRLMLELPDDFDLAATVTSHGWYRLAPFEWNGDTGELEHAHLQSDEVVAVKIRQQDHALEVRARGPVRRGDLEQSVRRMVQLDVDLREFHSLCSSSQRLRHVPRQKLGRLLCAPTLFEDAIKIILTTNTRWARTIEMNRLLVETFGTFETRGNAFPSPEQLADAGEDVIRERARVGYRARSIHQLSLAIVSGVIDLASRPDPTTAAYDDLHDWYLRFPGIGPYGAAHLMAMDGRHDRIAVDTEFRAWVRAQYHGGRDVRDATMLRHYRHWGQWQYIAYWCEMSGAPV